MNHTTSNGKVMTVLGFNRCCLGGGFESSITYLGKVGKTDVRIIGYVYVALHAKQKSCK